jgi:hypothetical protein
MAEAILGGMNGTATNQWIDPPEPPDPDTLERLRAVCHAEPRIASAWVTGSRFTRPDGTCVDSTAIALVFDPPLEDVRNSDMESRADHWAIIDELEAAAPIASGHRSWLYVDEAIIAAKAKHCRLIYSRVAPNRGGTADPST